MVSVVVAAEPRSISPTIPTSCDGDDEATPIPPIKLDAVVLVAVRKGISRVPPTSILDTEMLPEKVDDAVDVTVKVPPVVILVLIIVAPCAKMKTNRNDTITDNAMVRNFLLTNKVTNDDISV